MVFMICKLCFASSVVISFKEEQFSNATRPIFVTFGPTTTLVSSAHALKAPAPILVTPLEILIVLRLVQLPNAQSPISVTLSGIVILTSPEHETNVQS